MLFRAVKCLGLLFHQGYIQCGVQITASTKWVTLSEGRLCEKILHSGPGMSHACHLAWQNSAGQKCLVDYCLVAYLHSCQNLAIACVYIVCACRHAYQYRPACKPDVICPCNWRRVLLSAGWLTKCVAKFFGNIFLWCVCGRWGSSHVVPLGALVMLYILRTRQMPVAYMCGSTEASPGKTFTKAFSNCCHSCLQLL